MDYHRMINRIVWVGRDLKDYVVPMSLSWAGTASYSKAPGLELFQG